MAKPALTLLIPLALAACSPERPPGGRDAGDETAAVEQGETDGSSPEAGAASLGKSGAGGATAAPAAGRPRLARLKDSREGDAAAHYGTLEVEGRCIYVTAGGTRTLIASSVPGAHWDAAKGVLVADGAQLRPGTQIFLAGSFASAANLKGQWVDPPAQECVISRIWVASGIRRR